MKKRMFFMLLAVIAFLAVIGGFKFFQIKAAIAQGSSYQPPPEAVTTVIAKQEDWNSTVSAIGSVAAVNGVTVSADLPGVVSEINFDSGRSVSKGQVLVRLDTKQEAAQLASAIAQRDLAHVVLQRQKPSAPHFPASSVSGKSTSANTSPVERRSFRFRRCVRLT